MNPVFKLSSPLWVAAALIIGAGQFGFLAPSFAQVSQGLPPQISPLPSSGYSPTVPRYGSGSSTGATATGSLTTRPIYGTPPKAATTSTSGYPRPASSAVGGSTCLTCGIITGINESHRRPRPLWMSSTTIDRGENTRSIDSNSAEANNAQNNQPSSNSAAPAGQTSNRYAKYNSAGALNLPKLSDGAIVNPDQDIALRRTLTFETTVQMNDGTTRILNFDRRPAFNIGSKVKIVGTRLVPLY